MYGLVGIVLTIVNEVSESKKAYCLKERECVCSLKIFALLISKLNEMEVYDLDTYCLWVISCGVYHAHQLYCSFFSHKSSCKIQSER